jgi:hypothetical protein
MISMILIAVAIAYAITNVMVRLRGKRRAANTINAAKNPENSDNETHK